MFCHNLSINQGRSCILYYRPTSLIIIVICVIGQAHHVRIVVVAVINSSRERGYMLTARLQTNTGDWLWLNIVLHVRQPFSGDGSDAAIVCTNQVLLESEVPLFKMQSQLYSSQIARNPEFLSMENGPAQIIGQRPHGDMMLSLLTPDVDQSLFFDDDFLGMSVNAAQSEPQQPIATGLPPFGDGCQLNGNVRPMLKKDIIRAGLLKKLKRKAAEMASAAIEPMERSVCQPTKRARHVANGDSGPRVNHVPYIGSIVGTNEGRITSHAASTVHGGTQVMNVAQQDRIYAQLMTKEGMGLSQETLRLPATDVSHAGLTMTALHHMRDDLNQVCDVGPLTPESLMSGCNSPKSVYDLSIDVTEPLLPFALTPEPSPVSSPNFSLASPPVVHIQTSVYEQRVPSLVGDFEENFFFDADQDLQIFDTKQLSPPPADKPAVVNTNDRLPVLDVGSVNQFFGGIEEKKNRRNCQRRQLNNTRINHCTDTPKIGHSSVQEQQQQQGQQRHKLQCTYMDTPVSLDDIDQFMMVPGGMSPVSSSQEADPCGMAIAGDVPDETQVPPSVFMDVIDELVQLEMFANSTVFGKSRLRMSVDLNHGQITISVFYVASGVHLLTGYTSLP